MDSLSSGSKLSPLGGHPEGEVVHGALHVASLRSRLTDTPSEVRLLSDNVRALCDDIGRQAMALSEVRTAMGGGLDEMPTADRAPKDRKGHS